MWRGIAPWDKTEAVRPQMGRPRAQCEYVVWGSAGAMPAREEVGVLPGVLRHLVRQDDKYHIAGKPTLLMRELARWCVPGGLILDPFTGSGSTGAGALLEGRLFVGVEVDAHWHSVACRRLEAEDNGLSLRASEMGQLPIFGGQG